MSIFYRSTRDNSLSYTASEAILQGLSKEGGLFVPSEIPTLSHSLKEFADMSYKEVAYYVMKDYLSDFTEEELKGCIDRAYDEKFDTEEIAPVKAANGAYFLELYHGKTIAFKDMALSILPHLMITSAKKQGENKTIVILTATSGDTGKAALAGFADVPGTKIVVFYPKDGVSPLQERQMATQTGNNVKVIGIRGNFDEAQTGVKNMFADKALLERMEKNNFRFSSANSINIGRLVPQVVYYVFAYSRLLKTGAIKEGDPINITVPTGNFGNILAAYFAKLMGLPVNKLICASNSNKVLFDFFETGVYDKKRDFVLTMSPSMDILISSNLERLIFMATGNDDEMNRKLMSALSEKGQYEITEDMKNYLSDFVGGYTGEEETASIINKIYKNEGYLIDTHTAVAANVYEGYVAGTGDKTPTVIASTASPFKFTRSVCEAIGVDAEGHDDMALADILSQTAKIKLPMAIEELKSAKVLHDTVCDIDEMTSEVEKFLGV